MLVWVVWVAAALLAGALLGVLGLDLVGHVRRLRRSLADARQAVLPQVRRLAEDLAAGSQRGQPPDRRAS